MVVGRTPGYLARSIFENRGSKMGDIHHSRTLSGDGR
jgi:hypothetical protein